MRKGVVLGCILMLVFLCSCSAIDLTNLHENINYVTKDLGGVRATWSFYGEDKSVLKGTLWQDDPDYENSEFLEQYKILVGEIKDPNSESLSEKLNIEDVESSMSEIKDAVVKKLEESGLKNKLSDEQIQKLVTAIKDTAESAKDTGATVIPKDIENSLSADDIEKLKQTVADSGVQNIINSTKDAFKGIVSTFETTVQNAKDANANMEKKFSNGSFWMETENSELGVTVDVTQAALVESEKYSGIACLFDLSENKATDAYITPYLVVDNSIWDFEEQHRTADLYIVGCTYTSDDWGSIFDTLVSDCEYECFLDIDKIDIEEFSKTSSKVALKNDAGVSLSKMKYFGEDATVMHAQFVLTNPNVFLTLDRLANNAIRIGFESGWSHCLSVNPDFMNLGSKEQALSKFE